MIAYADFLAQKSPGHREFPDERRVDRHYRDPVMPGYWMDETSGVLRPAVEAYLLTDEELSVEHIAALRAYLRQWMAAPWRGGVVTDELRAGVDGLTSRAAIDAWLDDAFAASIDPL